MYACIINAKETLR